MANETACGSIGSVLKKLRQSGLGRWLCLLGGVLHLLAPLCHSCPGLSHPLGYDLAGNRTATYYGTGRYVQTSYDAHNRPEMISEGGRITRYGYDLAGRAVALVAGNGQTSSNTYDALGRLVDRTLFRTTGMSQSEVLAEFSWQHDLLGNVTQQLETWPGDATRAAGIRTTGMTYDGNNRLSTETITEPGGAVTATTYGYDLANNRTSKTVSGGTDPGVWSYTYNAANQLTTWSQRSADGTLLKSASLGYDVDGNRTSQTITGSAGAGINPPPAASGTTSYAWDSQGRLSSVTMPDGITQYAYDYDYRTRRIGTHKMVSGVEQIQTAIVFAGGLSLAEYENNGGAMPSTPTVEYTRGPDMGGGVGGMLYSMRSDGSTTVPVVKYSLSNGRGDVVAQSDSSAALTWTASYEAYGRRTQETGNNVDKQRGNSKDEDPTGLLNEGFRYRDLETGVWTARDPAGFVDGPNVYAYVKQNPWTGFDPDGLAEMRHYWRNKSGKGFRRIEADPQNHSKPLISKINGTEHVEVHHYDTNPILHHLTGYKGDSTGSTWEPAEKYGLATPSASAKKTASTVERDTSHVLDAWGKAANHPSVNAVDTVSRVMVTEGTNQLVGAKLLAAGFFVLRGSANFLRAGTSLQGAQLNRHLAQLEKYGAAGSKTLENGRIRYYGNVDPARTPGAMAGRRLVREWDPSTNATRTWHETVDHAGIVRQVRPETGGPKVHYRFDANSNYIGKW